MASESSTAVVAALCGNCALAITKFVAAAFSGSSAMISESIHSSVDTLDQLLLLLGRYLSKRPPDDEHPFGHGLELYFWTLIVAILIFAVGGGVSTYEGILHLIHPQESSSVFWNYVVLGCGFLFEGISLWFGYMSFRAKQEGRSIWEAIRKTKDPTLATVLLEDSAAILGLGFAFVGITVGHMIESPYPDGIASVAIGLLLMAVASLLVIESRKLLIGESADPKMVIDIRRIAAHDSAVVQVEKPLTMHFGPHEILVNLEVQFRNGLTPLELDESLDRIEKNIRQQHPNVRKVFLEASAIVNKRSAEGDGLPHDIADRK